MSLQTLRVGSLSPALALLKLAAGRDGSRVSPKTIIREGRAIAPHIATVAGRVLTPGNGLARVRLRSS